MNSHRFHAWMIAACCLALLAAVGCGDDDPVCPKQPVYPKTCVVVMDDAWAAEDQGSDPTTFYADYGLTFDNTNGFGLIGGMGNGDPGNWDIDGTNGTAAWGLWNGDHSIALPPSTFVSVDFLRGHNDGSITVTASFEGTEVSSVTITLTGAFDSETVSFLGPIDLLEWTNAFTLGLDNLRYTAEGVTCPPAFVEEVSARFEPLKARGYINSKAR